MYFKGNIVGKEAENCGDAHRAVDQHIRRCRGRESHIACKPGGVELGNQRVDGVGKAHKHTRESQNKYPNTGGEYGLEVSLHNHKPHYHIDKEKQRRQIKEEWRTGERKHRKGEEIRTFLNEKLLKCKEIERHIETKALNSPNR